MPFTLEKPVAPFQTLWMDTGSSPRYRTQTNQLPSTLNPTRSLSKNVGLSVSYTNYHTPPQTTSATNLKLHTNLSSNPDTPPVSTSINPQIPPSPQRHLKFQLSLFYSTAEEGHCDLAESLPFSFCFIFLSLSNAHLWARWLFSSVLGRCHSVTPSIFVCSMPFQVFPYYITE